MEEVLRQPQRSISSTVAAWGRTQHELPAEAVLDRTMAHLDATTAETLRDNFSWLKELLQRRPARNDRAWILTTGNQHCPDKQRLQQQLRPHVLERLRQRLPEPLALEAADTFTNMATSLWYQDFLTAMFPWLTAEEQLQFQQWFQDYEWNQYLSLPPSAAALARMDETGEEVDRNALPRGSADPVPPPPPSWLEISLVEHLLKLATPTFQANPTVVSLPTAARPSVLWTTPVLPAEAHYARPQFPPCLMVLLGSIRSGLTLSTASGKRRLAHLRLETQPAIDLLGMYQHAWDPGLKQWTGSSEERVQQLLQSRADFWESMRKWVRAVPRRNQLLIAGDANATLRPQPPYVGFVGGMQLSLDLAKAYDRLPRTTLVAALRRVHADPDLIALILTIHDNACLVIERFQERARVGMGRGIRQGCGLSPLLWICFTILVHDQLSTYLPAGSITSYADDFHVQWSFSHSREFKAACHTLPRIIADLDTLGREAAQLLKTYTCRRPQGRMLIVQHPSGELYGISATGIDAVSAAKFEGQLLKQLRTVKALQPIVKEWLKQRSRLQRPCEFCEAWYQVSPDFPMAAQADQQLLEARAELAQFSALHSRTPATTAPPSEAGTDMELDRDKRSADHHRPENPTKFAKGENKGDKQLSFASAPTGKGQSLAANQKLGEPDQEEANKTNDPGTGSTDLAKPDRNRRSPARETGKWGSQGWWGARRGQSQRQGRRDRDGDEDLKELVKQMGRLVLRLEDSQTIASLDTQFIMFIGTVADHKGWSLTANLYRVAQEWNQQKEQAPETLTQPLRVVLLHSFLEVLYHKIEAMEEDQDLRRARELGLVQDLETAPAYPYLRWDNQEKRHKQETMAPLSHQDAKVVVKMLQNLTACPNVIGRFHALHKLAPQHAAEVIPFSLQIQNR
ncbi:unnamed protein product, partial [Symbiodinium necroappetens]